MPPSKVDLSSATLGKAAKRFLETKAPSTALAYEKCLRRFVSYYDGSLEDFIGEIEKQIKDNQDKSLAQRVRPGEHTIRGFIQWHKDNEYAPKSTRQGIAALQNALKYYGILVSFDFIELPPNRPLRANDKHQWTLDQMRLFVDAAEYLRDKAFIMVAFQTGLSISDILLLNYGDIQEEYEAGSLPIMVHKYRQKTGIEFKTFLGHDAVQYLDIYLKTRGPLKPDTPLFTMLGNNKRATKGAIQKMLRDYAGKLDFINGMDKQHSYNPARPHSLRSAFRSRLTGKMEENLIEFFMAHDIGEEKKTYINLPDGELRQLYMNHEHLISINKTSLDQRTEAQNPGVKEAAFKNLENDIGKLKRENAELRAYLDDVVPKIREQVEKTEANYAEVIKELKELKKTR